MAAPCRRVSDIGGLQLVTKNMTTDIEMDHGGVIDPGYGFRVAYAGHVFVKRGAIP